MCYVMRAVLALSFACAAAPAQQVAAHWLPLGNAAATTLGVLWSHGYDDDPDGACGLSRVLAACRLERLRDAVPDLVASGIQVGGDHHIVFATVAGGHTERVMAAFAALCDDAEPIDADRFELLVARAALLADDAEAVYPGTMFASIARRRLGGAAEWSRPEAGAALEIAALSVEQVHAAMQRPVPVRIAAIGLVGDGVRRAALALPWPTPAVGVRGECTAAGVTSERLEPWQRVHRRTDSPWVSAAALAPGSEHRAAFALAIEWLSGLAARRLQLRGPEAFARAPLVAWSWLEADPIVRLCRRGEKHVLLRPGETSDATAEDECRATRRELERLLEEVRTRVPSAADVDAARRLLRMQLALPEAGDLPDWGDEPAILPGRLSVMLLSAHHGVDVEDLDTVGPEQVAAAVRSVLADDRLLWMSLLPAPDEPLGFRSR